MKRILVFFSVLVLIFSFVLTASATNSITSRLKGRLLLQVQDKGRIWYVDPVGLQKHEVTFANALNLFQNLALGITNADLIKIPADLDSISSSQDSDGDGYTDRAELQSGFSPYIAGAGAGKFSLDNNLAKKLKGRLLLQVQDKGRIWYIDQNGKRWEVTWGNLMSLFRKLALGITDKDLAIVGKVETANWKAYTNSEYGYEVRYPSDWTAQKPGEPPYPGPPSGMSFSKFLDSDNYCLFEIIAYSSQSDSDEAEKDDLRNKGYEESTINISGINATKLTKSQAGIANAIYFSYKDNNFRITRNRGFGTIIESNCISTFDQILSTFKFLD